MVEPAPTLPGAVVEDEGPDLNPAEAASPVKAAGAASPISPKERVSQVTGAVVNKASTLTDGALRVMGRGVDVLDQKVPAGGCCSRCLKRCRSLEDPVQLQRCSCGRMGFALLAAAAVSLIIWELMQGGANTVVAGLDVEDLEESSVELDVIELLSNVYVFLLAMFCVIFLGGDLFMFNQFLEIVNTLHTQVLNFRKHNDALEGKLGQLGHVEQGLQHVHDQMGGDIEATTNLLLDLDRFGKLQTVGAVVNQYFASDLDGSGHISGPEAQFLIPQLTLLWEMCPLFEKARFADYCEVNGLRLPELATILDHMVNNDSKACLQALESLCGCEVEKLGVTKEIAAEAECQRVRPGVAFENPASEVGSDIEANRRPEIIKAKNGEHAMAPADEESAREVKRKEPVALSPLFSLNTPSCMKKWGYGPFRIGERCSIWGLWHLIALCCVPVSIFFLIWCVLGVEIPNILLACAGLAITLGLTGTGKMLEVLRALRKLLKELRVENERLERAINDLGDKVEKLAVLQHGFEKLQEHCAGNVVKARSLIKQSNTKVKMEAMAVVTHLFKHAGLNAQLQLEGEAEVNFLKHLELVFGQVPGFDIAHVKSKVSGDHIGLNEVKAIVDVIATFGISETPRDERPGTADESAKSE